MWTGFILLCTLMKGEYDVCTTFYASPTVYTSSALCRKGLTQEGYQKRIIATPDHALQFQCRQKETP